MTFPQRAAITLPPDNLSGSIGGAFIGVAHEFRERLITLANLQPHHTVLDIGCGVGRVAFGLADYLTGPYIGFDIMLPHLEWARANISSSRPNFRFEHADLFNGEYNPNGRLSAQNYRFPCADASQDICFAVSLFTHLRRDDAKHYLRETARSLKPGGRALITAFLLDDEARERIAKGLAAFDLIHSVDRNEVFTSKPEVPEAAIGVDAEAFRRWAHEANLQVTGVYPGKWGHDLHLSYQDIIILMKA
jgi:SAM-dependent methyltransferase